MSGVYAENYSQFSGGYLRPDEVPPPFPTPGHARRPSQSVPIQDMPPSPQDSQQQRNEERQEMAQAEEFRKVKEDAIRLTLFNFDSDTAWDLGSAIRTIAEATGVDKPVSISITHANSDQPMFYASSAPGVTPDHMHYVECMRNAVKRWGKPTKYLNLQTPDWNARTPEAWHAGYTDLWHQKYSFFSGGWPIKVTGVEGVVAVVVVYGSAADPYGHDHDSNHTLILRGLEQIIRDQQRTRQRARV